MKVQKKSKTVETPYLNTLNRARGIQSHTIAIVDELMLQDDRDVAECMEVVDHLTNLLDGIVYDHSFSKGPSAVNLISTIREILQLTEAAYFARLHEAYKKLSKEELFECVPNFDPETFSNE